MIIFGDNIPPQPPYNFDAIDRAKGVSITPDQDIMVKSISAFLNRAPYSPRQVKGVKDRTVSRTIYCPNEWAKTNNSNGTNCGQFHYGDSCSY